MVWKGTNVDGIRIAFFTLPTTIRRRNQLRLDGCSVSVTNEERTNARKNKEEENSQYKPQASDFMKGEENDWIKAKTRK